METLTSTSLYNQLKHNIPRILSQMDRDADSPTFGSFDRNYWHFKIRDFSSIILQQGMLILQALKNYEDSENPYYNSEVVQNWLDGSVSFWCREQLKSGSFNEYYPFEAGYPPTAFSLYAVGLVMKEYKKEPCDSIKIHIQKAVKWLLHHPEKEALNQEAAGLAGLVLSSKIPGVFVNPMQLEDRLRWFYAQQTEEGWFPEYGGPDLGYLSVTIDCLWDIYETSKDKRALAAIEKAVPFIAKMVSVSGETPVMINSRNTDYIVTYGITRFAQSNAQAATLVRTLLKNSDHQDHYLNRTDDRYSCHYVGQSLFRTILHINNITPEEMPLPASTGMNEYFPQAGLQVIHQPGKASVYNYLRKGGIINVFSVNGIAAVDFGWRHKTQKGKFAVTHWLDDDYQLTNTANSWSVEGEMTSHGWMKSSPFRHMGLRVLSKLAGNRLIPLLKKLMIFGNPKAGIYFHRVITLSKSNELKITDSFTGKNLNAEMLKPAPHYSLRHVASAGLFVPEERICPATFAESEKSTFTRTIKL